MIVGMKSGATIEFGCTNIVVTRNGDAEIVGYELEGVNVNVSDKPLFMNMDSIEYILRKKER